MKIKNTDFPFLGDVVECEDIRFEDYESPSVEFLEEKTIVNDKKKRINRANPLPVFISPVSQIYHESHSNENKTGSSSIAPNSYEKEPTLFKTPNKMPRRRTFQGTNIDSYSDNTNMQKYFLPFMINSRSSGEYF